MNSDLGIKIPKKGDLIGWVKEGVFLINTSLTVKNSQALSHSDLWRDFSYSLFRFLNDKNRRIVWIIWGRKADRIRKECGINLTKSIISSHPSPFSCRINFFGSKPFSRTNKLLKEMNSKEINWERIVNEN
jgi:uracil-DNA glycosylase